jgi:hypothetical protein
VSLPGVQATRSRTPESVLRGVGRGRRCK